MLVYSQHLSKPFNSIVGGDIHVWTTTFGLAGDLEETRATFSAINNGSY
jgi:hypothetical protein